MLSSLSRTIRGTYRDSVALMQLSARIAGLAGVRQASAVMATAGNLALLREAGLLDGPVDAAPSDLLLVVRGDSEDLVRAALDAAEGALSGAAQPAGPRGAREIAPRTIQMGLAAQPGANLALISTPGEY